MEAPRLQVNAFPSDDEFARFVAELVAAISGVSEGVVAWLEAALRERTRTRPLPGARSWPTCSRLGIDDVRLSGRFAPPRSQALTEGSTP